MDDRIIIKRVQSGQVDAYALLVHKHHRNLLAFVFRMVKDADLAEDIGQEVFLKVYWELPHFDPERGTPFAAWLFIVARNQCISELRKIGRTELVSAEYFDQVAAEGETAETALIRKEELEALKATLQELPEPFRSTIILSLKGATLEEIARSCGVPQATVKTRLYRAKEKIMFLLKGHSGGIRYERSL